MKKFITLAFSCSLIIGCAGYSSTSAMKSYSATSESQQIDVFTAGDDVPYNYEVIGTTQYDDTGFSLACDYNTMIKTFIKETRKIGGDGVKLTNIKEPDYWSTCYRGTANIIRYIREPEKIHQSSSFRKKPGMPKIDSSVPTKQILVAVLETVSDDVTQKNENHYITNVLREEAIRVLPADQNFTIMNQEKINAMLLPEKSIEDCEGSCLVEAGRNISADYVVQARISSFGSSITVSVEVYEISSRKLVQSFNARASNFDTLEDKIRRNCPAMFEEIKRLSGER